MDHNPPAARPPLEPGDYYMEGPNLVFTPQYHLKRGSCCGSGCRHCPYGVADDGALADAGEEAPTAG
jgi:hypothetical protein